MPPRFTSSAGGVNPGGGGRKAPPGPGATYPCVGPALLHQSNDGPPRPPPACGSSAPARPAPPACPARPAPGGMTAAAPGGVSSVAAPASTAPVVVGAPVSPASICA